MMRDYFLFFMCHTIMMCVLGGVLVKSQNQTAGFINVACGLPSVESPYEDRWTNLTYTTDAKLVQDMPASRVDKAFQSNIRKQLLNLRFFPNGKRNCYKINVKQDTPYLIKATFLYGNYDGLNVIPTFELYLGPNIWAKVYANDTVKEVIHFTRTKSIQICLVDIGSGSPFINTLELRPLDRKTYRTTSGSLKKLLRFYLSNSTKTSIRHPADVYDRNWRSYFEEKLWLPITMGLSLDTNNNEYDPPERVMQTAAIPIDANAPLEVKWSGESPTTQFYVYLYFSELQTLQANDTRTREFHVFLNGASFHKPISPVPLRSTTVFNDVPKLCTDGKCVLQLKKTLRSTLPPILSALEVYTVMDILQLETNDDDVNGIKDVQDTYDLRRSTWQGDPCVPKQFLWEGLNCNQSDNSTPPTIISLDLSSSGLTGVIAEAIQSLVHLQQLDLSNNSLSGGVPDFLADMKSLFLINLSYNNLSGSVPQTIIQKKGMKLNVEGNPLLIKETGPCVEDKGKDHLKDIVVPVSIAVVVTSLAIIVSALVVLYFLCRQKRSPSVQVSGPPSNVQESDGLPTGSSELTVTTRIARFTYSQVTSMTNNFQTVIGKGGFGSVYRGFVNGAEQVAVKVLSQSSSQGDSEFRAEVQLLLKVHHKNLVGFFGYCNEGENLALIYEYMANGDLKEHMSGRRGDSFIMNWENRLKIATESAQGLDYLHSGCAQAIVHRDIKTTNILLNEHYEAKVADFGLSKSLPNRESHVSTIVAGTPGYLDPEYYRTGRLTTNSDVYSYGVVLLELLTNQPVVDQSREQDHHIGGWVRLKLTNGGDISTIMDPRLRNYNSGSARQYVELAMACLNPSSSERPTMSQVVDELKQCLASELSTRAGPSRDTDMDS